MADDDSVSFDDFTTDYEDLEEGQTLWDTVDIFGMMQAFSKSAIAAFLSILIGVVLSIRNAIGDVYVEAVGFAEALWVVVLGSPGEVQARLSEISGETIAETFGFVALPVSVLVSLSMFVVVAIILYVFLGWGGD